MPRPSKPSSLLRSALRGLVRQSLDGFTERVEQWQKSTRPYLEQTGKKAQLSAHLATLRYGGRGLKMRALNLLQDDPPQNIAALLHDVLVDPDYEVRAQAREYLQAHAPTHLAQQLATWMQSPSSFHRRRVLEALPLLEASDAKSLLCIALEDPDPQVHWDALQHSSRFPDDDIVALLLQRLAQTEAHETWQQQELFRRLGEFKHPDAIPPLLRWVQNPAHHTLAHSDALTAAIEALGNLGTSQVLQPLIQLYEQYDYDIVLHTHQDEKARVLDMSVTQRCTLLRAIGRFRDSRVDALLIAALDDTHPLVRERAVSILGYRGTVAAIPQLQQSLTEPAHYSHHSLRFFVLSSHEGQISNVAALAALALGALNTNDAYYDLLDLYYDQRRPFRRDVLCALGWLQKPEALSLLEEELQHAETNPLDSLFALQALARLLDNLTENEDQPTLPTTLLATLQAHYEHPPTPLSSVHCWEFQATVLRSFPFFSQAQPLLEKALHHERREVRDNALLALARCSPQTVYQHSSRYAVLDRSLTRLQQLKEHLQAFRFPRGDQAYEASQDALTDLSAIATLCLHELQHDLSTQEKAILRREAIRVWEALQQFPPPKTPWLMRHYQSAEANWNQILAQLHSPQLRTQAMQWESALFDAP